jgi:hypothetical protein
VNNLSNSAVTMAWRTPGAQKLRLITRQQAHEISLFSKGCRETLASRPIATGKSVKNHAPCMRSAIHVAAKRQSALRLVAC